MSEAFQWEWEKREDILQRELAEAIQRAEKAELERDEAIFCAKEGIQYVMPYALSDHGSNSEFDRFIAIRNRIAALESTAAPKEESQNG